jgi:hypothetical protein
MQVNYLAVDWQAACISRGQREAQKACKKAELNIVPEQRLGVCALEKVTLEMQDVLTRSMPSFIEGLIDTWAACSVRDETSSGETRKRNFCLHSPLNQKLRRL